MPGELATLDSTFCGAATRILQWTDSGRYDEALALCNSLQVAYPKHPAPYLSKAGVYVNWMQSYRLNDFQQEVDENAQKAIDTGSRLLDQSSDAWLSF